MTQNKTETVTGLIEKLESLRDSINGDYYQGQDWERKIIKEIIEQAKAECEPVAVIALKNAELNNRVCVLEDLLSSAYAIANRNGSDTHWPRFASQLHINGISPITAKTFKVLPSDVDYSTAPPADNLIAEKQATIDRLTSERDRLLEELRWTVSGLDDYYYDHATEKVESVKALIAEIEGHSKYARDE